MGWRHDVAGHGGVEGAGEGGKDSALRRGAGGGDAICSGRGARSRARGWVAQCPLAGQAARGSPVGMMGMVFSASTTVLADSTVPPIVPTSMRTTAPSKGPSQAVPLLVPVSNLCAVRESSSTLISLSCRRRRSFNVERPSRNPPATIDQSTIVGPQRPAAMDAAAPPPPAADAPMHDRPPSDGSPASPAADAAAHAAADPVPLTLSDIRTSYDNFEVAGFGQVQPPPACLHVHASRPFPPSDAAV